MGRYAQDTLARANQSGLGTSSDGEVWTETGLGTLSISSNEGVIVSASTDTHVQLGSNTAADAIVLCRMTINTTGDICGVQARFSPGAGTTSYKLLWYGGAIHINKGVAGANSQLTSVAFTVTPGTFYWWKLVVVGSTLSGKIWQDGTAEPGSFTTTTTDTSITGAGGFAILGQTNGGSTGIQFDHFSALPVVPVIRAPRGLARVLSPST